MNIREMTLEELEAHRDKIEEQAMQTPEHHRGQHYHRSNYYEVKNRIKFLKKQGE